MAKTLSSPFGSQLALTQGPQGRDPIVHLCADPDYYRAYMNILRSDLRAGVTQVCLDGFPLRNEFDPQNGGGAEVARAIVSRQHELVAKVYQGRRVPDLTAALHAKLGDCYSGDQPDGEAVTDLTRRQAELFERDTRLLFETVASRFEAERILNALKYVGRLEGSQLAFTLNEAFRLPSGEDPYAVLADLSRRFPEVGFGLNCFPPHFEALRKLLGRLKKAGISLQVIYPNTDGFGGTIEKEGVHGSTLKPHLFAQHLHGTTVPFNPHVTLGACCGGHAGYVHALNSQIHGGTQWPFALAA